MSTRPRGAGPLDHPERKSAPNPLQVIDTIVVLTEYPLTSRDYERYGVPVFLANGLAVEVWDLSAIIRPSDVRPLDALPSTRMGSLAQFRAGLSILPPDRSLLLSFLSRDTRTWPFFRAISRSKIPYAIRRSAFAPSERTTRPSLWHRLHNLRLRPLVEQAFTHLNSGLLRVSPPRIVLAAGGSQVLAACEAYGKDTDVIPAQAHDYDIYRSCREQPTSLADPTAVFLDEYLPFHPDYQRVGEHPYAAPREYYPKLNRLFDTVEERLGLRVIIAAHPRSRYEEHGECFAERKVIKGRTAELVRDARMVLLHASTSVSFAVLFGKAMIFLTSDALERSLWRGYIHALAAEFGKSPLNVDHITPGTVAELDTSVVKSKYTRYIDRYLKTKGTMDKPCWQLFIDHLRSQ